MIKNMQKLINTQNTKIQNKPINQYFGNQIMNIIMFSWKYTIRVIIFH